jgi:hypothetical protein
MNMLCVSQDHQKAVKSEGQAPRAGERPGSKAAGAAPGLQQQVPALGTGGSHSMKKPMWSGLAATMAVTCSGRGVRPGLRTRGGGAARAGAGSRERGGWRLGRRSAPRLTTRRRRGRRTAPSRTPCARVAPAPRARPDAAGAVKGRAPASLPLVCWQPTWPQSWYSLGRRTSRRKLKRAMAGCGGRDRAPWRLGALVCGLSGGVMFTAAWSSTRCGGKGRVRAGCRCSPPLNTRAQAPRARTSPECRQLSKDGRAALKPRAPAPCVRSSSGRCARCCGAERAARGLLCWLVGARAGRACPGRSRAFLHGA